MVELKYIATVRHLLLSASIALFSCGQPVKGVQSSYWVSKTVFPGRPPIQNASQPNMYHPDTINTVYVEVKGGYTPVWAVARQNNRLFSVTTSAVDGDSVQLGQTTNNTPAVISVTQKGNRLWQLQLKPTAQDTNLVYSPAYLNNIIFYQHSGASKKTTVQISRQIELMPERRP